MSIMKFRYACTAARLFSLAAMMAAPLALPAPASALEPVMCTMEAKICPDGSAVSRTGPNCEFAPCPGEDEDPGAAPPSKTPPRVGDIVKDNIRQKKNQPRHAPPATSIENPAGE